MDEPNKNTIGPRIRATREAMTPSVSHDDLAGRMARYGVVIDRSAVSRIESQTRSIKDYEIIAIAKSLIVTVAYLFGEQ